MAQTIVKQNQDMMNQMFNRLSSVNDYEGGKKKEKISKAHHKRHESHRLLQINLPTFEDIQYFSESDDGKDDWPFNVWQNKIIIRLH